MTKQFLTSVTFSSSFLLGRLQPRYVIYFLIFYVRLSNFYGNCSCNLFGVLRSYAPEDPDIRALLKEAPGLDIPFSS